MMFKNFPSSFKKTSEIFGDSRESGFSQFGNYCAYLCKLKLRKLSVHTFLLCAERVVSQPHIDDIV